MELIKLGLKLEDLNEHYYKDNDIVIDNIIPVGYRIMVEEKTQTLTGINFLFEAIQSCSESYFYLCLNIGPTNPMDLGYIIFNNPYLFDKSIAINNDEELKTRISNLGSIGTGIYQTDFSGNLSENNKDYEFYGVIKDSNTIIKFILPKIKYIKLKSFITRFTEWNETIFIDYNNTIIDKAEFIEPRDIKLDATSVNENQIFNHYLVKTGPAEYKFNFASPKHKELPVSNLQNLMNEDMYDSFYDSDPFPFSIVYESNADKLYIIYIREPIIIGGQPKCYIFSLNRDLINKTNLLNPYKNYRISKEDIKL